jgi:hypothetical protein
MFIHITLHHRRYTLVCSNAMDGRRHMKVKKREDKESQIKKIQVMKINQKSLHISIEGIDIVRNILSDLLC